MERQTSTEDRRQRQSWLCQLPAASETTNGQSLTGGIRGSITALTDAATITPDFDDNNNFSVTLAGNRTLANPSNITAGQSGVIVVTQGWNGQSHIEPEATLNLQAELHYTDATASAVDVISRILRALAASLQLQF